jgi:putative oxidoreductase
MTTTHFETTGSSGPFATIHKVRGQLGKVPLPVIDLLLRIGIALVFWKSGMAKIANWDLTVQLFADEYQVPLLSPDLAALLATSAELACPVLLVVGIGARLGAAALLGMTFVIQTIVYPDNWSEHLLWASILLYILSRGPGALSVDHVVARLFGDGAAR